MVTKICAGHLLFVQLNKDSTLIGRKIILNPRPPYAHRGFLMVNMSCTVKRCLQFLFVISFAKFLAIKYISICNCGKMDIITYLYSRQIYERTEKRKDCQYLIISLDLCLITYYWSRCARDQAHFCDD